LDDEGLEIWGWRVWEVRCITFSTG
jgi:hypothetical protein